VKASTWLELDRAIPIRDGEVWRRLSFTKDLPEGSLAWTGKVRGSLVRLDDDDGGLLAEMLRAQSGDGRLFPIDDQDKRKLASYTVVRSDKVVSVSVPDDPTPVEESGAPCQKRRGKNQVASKRSLQRSVSRWGCQSGFQKPIGMRFYVTGTPALAHC